MMISVATQESHQQSDSTWKYLVYIHFGLYNAVAFRTIVCWKVLQACFQDYNLQDYTQALIKAIVSGFQIV